MGSNMKDLKQRIKEWRKKAIVVGGLVYIGCLGSSYAIVEDSQTSIMNAIGIKPKINYTHLYNPIKFYKDNKEIIKQGKELREPVSENTITGAFPTVG